MDDTIADKDIDRTADQTRVVEAESSQIWVGRLIPISSTENGWLSRFSTPRSTRLRQVQSVEQPKDGVSDEVGVSNAIVAYEVVAGEVVTGEVDEEVVVDVVVGEVVVYEVVQPDVVVLDSFSFVTTDIKLIAHLAEPSVHSSRGFP